MALKLILIISNRYKTKRIIYSKNEINLLNSFICSLKFIYFFLWLTRFSILSNKNKTFFFISKLQVSFFFNIWTLSLFWSVSSYNFYPNHLHFFLFFIQVGIHCLDKHVYIASNRTHRRKDLIAIRNLNVNFYHLKKNLNARTVHTKANVRIIYGSTCSNILNTQKIQWKLKVVDSTYTLDEHGIVILINEEIHSPLHRVRKFKPR